MLESLPYGRSNQSHGNCKRKEHVKDVKSYHRTYFKASVGRRGKKKQIRTITKRRFTLPVTPFIVIPRDEFHEVLAQSNTSLGIKNAGPAKNTPQILIYLL